MINFYSLYNNTGLHKEPEYRTIITKFFNTEPDERTKPLVKIEHIIRTSPVVASYYAVKVLKVRWPEAEPYIKTHAFSTVYYIENVIKERWHEGESSFITNPEFAFQYAKNVIKGRWPEAEEYIKQDNFWWTYYKIQFEMKDEETNK